MFKKLRERYQDKLQGIEDKLSSKGFIVSKKIIAYQDFFYIDDKNKKWAYCKDENSEPRIYDYKDILDFEVKENGDSIMQGNSGGTLIGGIAFGAVGALIGSAGKKKVTSLCSSLSLIITVNDINNPNIVKNYIGHDIPKNSSQYSDVMNQVNEVTSLLTFMQKQVGTDDNIPSGNDSNASLTEQITQLAELNKNGILTDEEFTAKKKQLLKI